MRISVVGVLVAMAACGDDGNMFPVGGGGTVDAGPTGDGARPVDARTPIDSPGMPAIVDASLYVGRVCLANDPRRLNVCADTGAGGLTVRLGTAVTTTSDNGGFTIEAQGASEWRVTGTNIVSSYMLLGDFEIPAITRADYAAMLSTNSVMPNPGEGAVMIQTIQNGAPVTGATATTTPTTAWAPFYDSTTEADWAQGAIGTSTNGAIWIPGADVVSMTVVAVRNPAGTGTTVSTPSLPVRDGGITFATVIFAGL